MPSCFRTILPTLTLAVLLAGCGYTPDEYARGLAYDDYVRDSKMIYAAIGNPQATPTAETLRAMILKNQSFEMDLMPIGYWNYVHLGSPFKQYIDEEAVIGWADNGVTVMKGPEWSPDDPEQLAHHKQLMDWCETHGVKVMVRDWRMYRREDGKTDMAEASIADFADHPAFFGYHCYDEPRFDPNDPDALGPVAQALWMREQLPDARPFVSAGAFTLGAHGYMGVESYPHYFDRFGKEGALDFFSANQYAGMYQGRLGWNDYFTNLRLLREASWTYGIPFWTTLCSVSHFGMPHITHDTQNWQFNTAIASGSTGVLWYYYYMRNPQKDYRDSPVDAFWERTDTWDIMRKIHQGSHGRYGDLFLNLAVTRVSFLPHGYGGGNVFEKDTSDVVGNVLAASDETIPLMISEFIDLEGRRYAMFVNLDRERSVFMGVRYPGEDVEIYAYAWNSGGKEYRWAADTAYGVPSPVQRREDALIASYQLGPGDAFLQRVDSTRIRRSELTLQMRALAGLEPQEPLDVELARAALANADTDRARQEAQAKLDACLARQAAPAE
jgi:hypothetical protein